MKKTVLQLSIQETRIRKKALVTVSGFPGVNSLTMDDKTGKLTITGDVDIPVIVMKLRKICDADITSVEEVKPPPEKKPEPKPEPAKPAAPKPEVVAFPVMPMNYQYQQFQQYQPSYPNTYYHQPYNNSRVMYDEPQGCVIM